MLYFYLPLLICSIEQYYLTHSFIYLMNESCDYLQSNYTYRHENPEIYCQNTNDDFNNGYDECVTYYKSIKNFYCANKHDASSYFGKLSNNIDTLYIINDNEDLTLDFSELKEQLKVVIINNDLDDGLETNNEEIDTKIFKILSKNMKEFKKNDKIIPKSELPIISFDGNIKEKVSYMIVYQANLKIVNNDLNIHTLLLDHSSISPDSKMIKTDTLIVEAYSRKNIESVENDLIQVNQLGLYLKITYNAEYIYVEFLENSWYLRRTNSYQDKFYSILNFGSSNFNYSMAKTINIISDAYYYILDNKLNIQSQQNVNLTHFKNYNPYSFLSKAMKNNKERLIYHMSIRDYGNIENSTNIKIYMSLESDRDYNDIRETWIIKSKNYQYIPKKIKHEFNYWNHITRLPKQSFIFIESINKNCLDAKEFFSEAFCDKWKNEDDRFEGGYIECQHFFNSTENMICTDNININEELSKISEKTENLYIFNYVDYLNIDLAKLRKQSRVVIFNNQYNNNNESFYLSKMVKVFESKSDKKVTLNTVKGKRRPVIIKGGIREKVSYLTVTNCELVLMLDALDVHTLCLLNSVIDNRSTDIKVSHLVNDYSSYSDSISDESIQKLIQVDQLALIYDSDYHYDFRVSYDNQSWNVYSNKLDIEIKNKIATIPYSIAQSFGLITISQLIDINIESDKLTSLKNLNLTLLDISQVRMPNISVLPLLEDNANKFKVEITSSGDWSKIEKNLNVTIVADDESYKIEKTNNNKINFVVDPVFVYESRNPKRQPSEFLPKFAVILVTSNETYAKEVDEFFTYHAKNDEVLCKDEDCYNHYEAFSGFYSSNGTDLNDQLKKISSEVKFIYIYSIELQQNEIVADFNNLKSQAVVMFSDDTKDLSDFLKDEDKVDFFYADTFNFVQQITRKLHKGIKSSTSENVKLKLEGSIKRRVSYLTIAFADVTIINNDLNIHSLLLLHCTLNSNSKMIRTNTFIVDMYKFNDFIKSDKYSVSHFGIFSLYRDQPPLNITYTNSDWEIKAGSVATYKIPYSKCDMFEYLGDMQIIRLIINDESVTQAKTINFTFYNLKDRFPESPINFPEFPIHKKVQPMYSRASIDLYKVGNWNGISGYPIVYFTADGKPYIYGRREAKGIALITKDRFVFGQEEEYKKKDPNEIRYSYIFAGNIPEFMSYIEPNRFTYASGFCYSSEADEYFDDSDHCCRFFSSLESISAIKEISRYSTDITNIDDQLSQVSDLTDHLFIIRYKPVSITLNFKLNLNLLKTQMKVTVIEEFIYTYGRSTIWEEVDGEKPDYGYDSKILQRMLRGKKKIKETEWDSEEEKEAHLYNRALPQLRINGNTDGKVSHLTIAGLSLQVTDSNMKLDTLVLAQSTFDNKTKEIEVNNLLADYSSIKVIFGPNFSYINKNIKTNQFIYYTSYDYDIDNKNLLGYIVTYKENSVSYKMYLDDGIDSDYIIDSYDIPYSFANSFGLIPQGLAVLLECESSNVKTVKDFNLTIIDHDPLNCSNLINYYEWYKYSWERKEKFFYVGQQGDWSGVTNKPNIYLTYNENEIEMDKTDIEELFTLKKEEPYNGYVSKKNQLLDNPNVDDVITPEQTVVTINVTDKDNNQIQDEIQNTLTNGFENTNKNNNKVVEIKEPIDFTSNKEYNDNEWIKFSSDSKITLDGGNLNIVLPDNDGSSITIEVKDAENVNLSIQGKGEINLESSDKTKKSFNIKGKSSISGDTKIIVPTGTQSIKIDSIDLTEIGSIQVQDDSGSDLRLNVDTVKVQSRSTTTLNNVKIVSSIIIPQSSTVNLEDVDVAGAKNVYNLMTYANFYKPLITGSLENEPNAIIINATSAKDSPKGGDDFIVIHAKFDCSKYLEKLNIENTKFTEKFCQIANYATILSGNEKQDLIMNIPYVPSDNDPDEPNNNEIDKDKLKKIIKIIIIVVVVVVVLGIIIGVVACCCTRKKEARLKKKYNMSEGEDTENKVDDL